MRRIRPSKWALWSLPRRVIVYLLVVEVAVLAALITSVLAMTVPDGREWLTCLVLIACGGAHVHLSRRTEEQRRGSAPGPHIDLTSIWTLPAVLLLPVPLMALVVIAIRTQRYLIARRPLFRFAFSTSSILLAALAARGMLDLLGVPAWTTAHPLTMLAEAGTTLAAALAYGLTQLLVVAGVIALSMPKPARAELFGTAPDNALEAMTIALGAVAAVVLIHNPFIAIALVPAAAVLNRIALLRQLERDASTDSLTGLLNRRGWLDRANRTLVRADHRAALLMLDLDHFKSINDTYGHVAGDDVLRAVAEVLRESTRAGDLVGRWGGEEFIVLLPEVSRLEAHTVAERIRAKVREMQVPTTHRRGGHVVIIEDRTTSVGLGISPDHGPDLDSLVAATDAALYRAKESGRDRVEPAEPALHLPGQREH
ncbi:diguanylate cyclase [Crossiella sp. CA198]|uniref:GGDEF domain-containing protein n=1 Tax=Crossiella sp. CA198 TaxID=3455607 RepID=UPI003F8D5CD3